VGTHYCAVLVNATHLRVRRIIDADEPCVGSEEHEVCQTILKCERVGANDVGVFIDPDWIRNPRVRYRVKRREREVTLRDVLPPFGRDWWLCRDRWLCGGRLRD